MCCDKIGLSKLLDLNLKYFNKLMVTLCANSGGKSLKSFNEKLYNILIIY